MHTTFGRADAYSLHLPFVCSMLIALADLAMQVGNFAWSILRQPGTTIRGLRAPYCHALQGAVPTTHRQELNQ